MRCDSRKCEFGTAVSDDGADRASPRGTSAFLARRDRASVRAGNFEITAIDRRSPMRTPARAAGEPGLWQRRSVSRGGSVNSERALAPVFGEIDVTDRQVIDDDDEKRHEYQESSRECLTHRFTFAARRRSALVGALALPMASLW